MDKARLGDIVEGETGRAVSLTLEQDDVAFNLTGATAVTVEYEKMGFESVLLTKSCTVVNAAAGQISHDWASGDLGTSLPAGFMIWGRVKVTKGGVDYYWPEVVEFFLEKAAP